MAYDPKYLRTFGVGLSGGNNDTHVLDTIEAITTLSGKVLSSGYVSDGFKRGLKVGDLVLVRQYTSLADRTVAPLDIAHCFVTVAGTQASPAATLKKFSSAGPVQLPVYTVATVPAVASYTGGLIYVSDAASQACPCYSDGTNWRRVDTSAILS